VSKVVWQTYCHDGARTGRASSSVPAKLVNGWETDIGGVLTSLVVADGKVFLAQSEAHTVHALDAKTGDPIWSRTVGARVDSPPTIHDGLCLFGCRDGYVYCLRASDGALVWRFLAAPEDRQIIAYDQLESAWPVHGNILIEDGSAYFVAGRCSYLGKGLVMYRLDPSTGKVENKSLISGLDEETGREPDGIIFGTHMPGALPDVLSSDGASIFMRQCRFDKELNGQRSDTPHIFSSVGFLDGSWWHRTYLLYGKQMQSGWGGWGKSGYRAPAGRMLVLDDTEAYAFGRLNQYGTAGTHVGLSGNLHPWGEEPVDEPHYVLFATSKEAELVMAMKARRGPLKELKPRWEQPSDLWVRAMVLADDTLLLAGISDPLKNEDTEARRFPNEQPGILRMLSPNDGTQLAEYPLSACPTYDAMAVAQKRVYIATVDGKVMCLKGK